MESQITAKFDNCGNFLFRLENEKEFAQVVPWEIDTLVDALAIPEDVMDMMKSGFVQTFTTLSVDYAQMAYSLLTDEPY